ncbi:MAG: hypothetical protein K0U78_13065, partial [Actinomycetia bacterium]|nr:hypothetical protein [Actinomycetes bacterium]
RSSGHTATALVPQHFAAMPNRLYPHASVVVDVPDLTASAGVLEVVIQQALIVIFDMMIAV